MSVKEVSRLGETAINNDGDKMTIVAYRNASDIDVLFENGEIAKHKKYSWFRQGKIRNPQVYKDFDNRVGERRKNKQGDIMTIIEYKDSQNILVCFDDGYTVSTSYSNFCKGLIKSQDVTFTDEENKLILELYPTNKERLLLLLPHRTVSSIKSQYYRIAENVTEQNHYGLLRLYSPDIWEEVVDKEKYINVSAGSNQYIDFQFSCGHIGKLRPVQRIHGAGCPYCNGKRVLKGFNDLQTVNPTLALEWNYEKNCLSPDEVLPSSNKKVWWRCKRNHEWEANINNRNRKHYGCPICTKIDHESIGERLVKESLDKNRVSYIREFPINDGVSTLFIDFFTNYGAIEFDGEQHFKPVEWFGGIKGYQETVQRDARKNEYCKQNNIPLLRIKFDEIDKIDEKIMDFILKGQVSADV